MGRGKSKKITGLGDIVAKVTDFVGIVPCQSCLERQAKWNTLFPVKLKPRELTDTELKEYQNFQSIRTLKLSNEQRLFLCKIYSDVFKVPYFEPCVTCSASPYIVMIERMDKIVKTYEN
jgi:hypothetical protein